ncbi:MAG: DUF4153 domain-containing protein [Bacteroidetes bacterium]|nr:DUF4153 domain-containing protein [Bacteroidota bacterium]
MRRFPLEILIAVVGSMAAVMLALEIPLYTTTDPLSLRVYSRIILGCIILLSTTLSLSLTREAGKITWPVQVGTVVTAAAAVTWYMWVFSFTTWDELQCGVIILAVHLLVALSAMWRRDRLEFWDLNKALFLRTLTAGLFTVVLGSGLNLALFALNELFGLDVNGSWYGALWAVLLGLFNTWFVLGGIPLPPSDDAERTTPSFPRGLRIFVQYVLLPLVLVFLCILYAYGIKVLFFTQLNGSVAYFIDTLAVVGTLSFLLLYPLRNDAEHAWIHFYASWFGRLMLPLCVLLWIALIVRVQTYGITEQRYLGLALAVVLTVLALYLAIVRNPDLRIIPAALLLACIVSVSGPIGMLQVAYRSQTQRAEDVLRAGGVVHDGRYDIAKAQQLSEQDKRIVQSTLRYLTTYESNSRMDTWLASIHADRMPDRDSVKIEVYMGVWTEVDLEESGAFAIGDGSTSRTAHAVSHMKGASITPFALNWNQPVSRSEDTLRLEHNGTWLFEILRSKGTMWRLQDPTGRADTFDLAKVLAQISDRSDTTTISVNLQSDKFPDYNVALVLSRLNGRTSNGTWEEVFARGVLVTTPK